eukprot:GSChrysophyteH1.ASY1.ANO1.2898.1 assembled CDS
MEKYSHVRENLVRMLQKGGGNTPPVEFRQSPLATLEELETTHCPNYVRKFVRGEMSPKDIRATGFPWTKQGVNRSLSSVGGTVACMRENTRKVAAHLAGGTHHAFYDRGEGFCVFSDIAVAANLALREYSDIFANGGGILIVDLDVHQGNGNAALFKDNRDVFTFNMHCSGNIFSERQTSDCDIDLPNGCTGGEYLSILQREMLGLMDQLRPQLIFFQSGVDVLRSDRLGKMNLTRDDVRERNALVYEAARSNNTPIVVTMGGGYPKDISTGSPDFIEVVGAHTDVYRQIVEHYS